MELKLVYRALRKISDWTVTGYYSETDVQGVENVPDDGPLIMYVLQLARAQCMARVLTRFHAAHRHITMK